MRGLKAKGNEGCEEISCANSCSEGREFRAAAPKAKGEGKIMDCRIIARRRDYLSR
jgi:hypothetical protein